MSWTGPTSISNGSTRFTGRTFFITRAKPNANLRRAYSAPNDRTQGIVCSQTVALSGFYRHKHFPHHLCSVRFRGAQKCRAVEFTRRGKPVAVLFCVVRFGLKPRIATERSDAGESRISKILDLIQSSRYSIHDLCRCQARDAGEYYRLNMPFELGLDFGCRRYGAGRLTDKVILVLEEERYRYQATISDLAGSDIEAHHGDYQLAVRKVRNWLAGMPGFERSRCRASAGRLRGLPRMVFPTAAKPWVLGRRNPGLFNCGTPTRHDRLARQLSHEWTGVSVELTIRRTKKPGQ